MTHLIIISRELRSRTRNSNVVTFDPTNFRRGHVIIMTGLCDMQALFPVIDLLLTPVRVKVHN